ncbi:hypothetical protein [Caulobacter sp. CCH5-E12]|uniref:DUF7673 family protein n=1 Tax=Caulobacter sp. CCH5-E12 TaxID=1768770 RepID=UPI000780EB10|nr:hypothetical protein [Caulobacter sp. CCH5-E12]
MVQAVAFMDPATFAAIERLIRAARGDTHQSRYAANFLLAWWNAKDLGGFDLTDMWGVDEALSDDMVSVFRFVSRHNEYPSTYSFRSEFEELVRLWRPHLFEPADA